MFDWREYLQLARSLGDAGGEAHLRSAVSRAYYSVFCTARNWLSENEQGFVISSPGESHKAVWDRFDQGHERLKKRIATDGRRLRAQRVIADYQNDVSGLDKTKDLVLQRAETILKLIDQLKM